MKRSKHNRSQDRIHSERSIQNIANAVEAVACYGQSIRHPPKDYYTLQGWAPATTELEISSHSKYFYLGPLTSYHELARRVDMRSRCGRDLWEIVQEHISISRPP